MIILKKNAIINDEELHDKYYNYYFMNSSKYHYIAVIEPNALLEKFLLCLPLGIDFVQITSVIFKLMKNLNNIKLIIWNHNHIDLEIAEKFTTVLNKKTNKLKEKPGNI